MILRILDLISPILMIVPKHFFNTVFESYQMKFDHEVYCFISGQSFNMDSRRSVPEESVRNRISMMGCARFSKPNWKRFAVSSHPRPYFVFDVILQPGFGGWKIIPCVWVKRQNVYMIGRSTRINVIKEFFIIIYHLVYELYIVAVRINDVFYRFEFFCKFGQK